MIVRPTPIRTGSSPEPPVCVPPPGEAVASVALASGAALGPGSGPFCRPSPFASSGIWSTQPTVTTAGSVSLPPSGCVRPLFSSKISLCRSPSPRNRSAIM